MKFIKNNDDGIIIFGILIITMLAIIIEVVLISL
jgi:hypothetical protein